MLLFAMLAASASIALYLGLEWALDRKRTIENRRALREIVRQEEGGDPE